MSQFGTMIAVADLTSGEGFKQHVSVSGHELVADEPETRGGQGAGPTPFELVLAGLAACTSITLRMYAERHDWQIGVLRVVVRLYADGDKRRIERVLCFSADASIEQRERLADIAEKTPVTRALREGMAIETTISPA
jgi:putative redox protein